MTTFQLPSGRHTATRSAAPERLGWGIVLPLVAVLVMIWLVTALQVLLPSAESDQNLVPVPTAQAAPRPPAPGR